MLKLFWSLGALNFGKLMRVYHESNANNAHILFPREEKNLALLSIEQELYQYLKEVFFSTEGAFYAVWETDGNYASALRIEPYREGMLLTALETAPEYRRRGFATSLIQATAGVLRQRGVCCVYSHVDKQNQASLSVHKLCGFEQVLAHAVYIDGSVTYNSFTLCLQL